MVALPIGAFWAGVVRVAVAVVLMLVGRATVIRNPDSSRMRMVAAAPDQRVRQQYQRQK